MARTRQSPVLLLPADEIALQAALVAAHPHVRIVDHGPWPDARTPPVCASVTETGSVAGIWPTDLSPALPTEVRSDGTVWDTGIGTGPAIQWWRSRVEDDVLSAGRLAATITPGMEDFARSVFRILFRLTTKDLVRHHQPTGEPVRMPAHRVGPHARSEARAGRIVLVDRALTLHVS